MTEQDGPGNQSDKEASAETTGLESRLDIIARVQRLTAERQTIRERMKVALDERDEMRLNDELRRVTTELDEAMADEEATRPQPPGLDT